MTRWGAILCLLAVVCAPASRAAAQPRGDRPDRPSRGPASRPDGPGPRIRQNMQRWAERADKLIDDDLAWLRQRGLDPYADKVAELRQTDAPGQRVMLWRIHRWIQGLRRLPEEDARRAVDELLLELTTVNLAKEVRAAEGQHKAELETELREGLRRQFDLKIDVQQAMMKASKKRLDQIREQLQKHAALEDDLIDRRFDRLTDAKEPLPDPLLEAVPEIGDGEKPTDAAEAEDGPRRGPRRPVRPERGPGRWAERLDNRFEKDIAWLRKKELKALADRAEQILNSDAPAKRMMLWRIHRWIQQLRPLKDADATRAIEEVNLGFSVANLARQYREAAEEDREQIAAKLRDALRKQFKARQAAQRAILEAIRSRLDRTREGLRRQRQLKKQLIERRFRGLTDPSRPLPEPRLVPPLRGEANHRRGSRPTPKP